MKISQLTGRDTTIGFGRVLLHSYLYILPTEAVLFSFHMQQVITVEITCQNPYH